MPVRNTLAPAKATKSAAPVGRTFVYDLNLGFPASDRPWVDLFQLTRCHIASTADLDSLTRELEAHEATAAYVPAANAYHVRQDPAYTGIATATTGKTGATTMSSVLVARRDDPVNELAQLRGCRYGRINAYCTTSYFAPAILLQQNGFSIRNFFGSISDVGAWQKQIDAVVAGTIDATMVDEDTWLATAQNADNTRVIAKIDQLPTPVVIGQIDAAHFLSALTQSLLAEPRRPDQLFSGFVEYQRDTTERFFAAANLAFA